MDLDLGQPYPGSNQAQCLYIESTPFFLSPILHRAAHRVSTSNTEFWAFFYIFNYVNRNQVSPSYSQNPGVENILLLKVNLLHLQNNQAKRPDLGLLDQDNGHCCLFESSAAVIDLLGIGSAEGWEITGKTLTWR